MKLFKNKPIGIIIFELLLIIIGVVGITFAISNFLKSVGVNATAGKLEIENIGQSVSSNPLMPVQDSNITSSTTADVLRITFSVKGSANNNVSDPIYDVALKNLVLDCELMNENTKWRLYKNGSLLSSGSLSPTFDSDVISGNLTLTQIQQDLPSSSSDADSYVFILWISETCTGDITTCENVAANTNEYVNINANISILLYSGVKKQINRETDSTFQCNAYSFADDSWATIVSNIKEYPGAYKVGDTKCITLDGFTSTNDNGCSSGEFEVRVANRTTPNECSGSDYSQTACGFVVEFIDGITSQKMNSSSTTTGSWPESAMHTYVNETIYEALPSDLQALIIPTKSVTGYGAETGTIFTSDNDKIYLLSPMEVYGATSNVLSYDSAYTYSRQLDYYLENVQGYSYAAAAKKINNSTYYTWLRTPQKGSSSYFNFVHSGGSLTSNPASNSFIVSPAFRIG